MERAAELSLLARDVLVRCPCRQHVGSAIDSQSAARSANTGNARRGVGGRVGGAYRRSDLSFFSFFFQIKVLIMHTSSSGSRPVWPSGRVV